jgi:hypothetical protein
MRHDDDSLDRPPQDKPERVTLVQARYPESWSFGAFGSDYKRTWWGRAGEAIPELKGKKR